MTTTDRDPVHADTGMPSIAFAPRLSLWDRVRANLLLLPRTVGGVAFLLLGPATGAMLLLRPGTRPVDQVLIAAGFFLLAPLAVALGVLIGYATNKAAREPFTYSFDDDGIHVAAVTHAYTHRWNAITHVRPLAGFLMVFFGRGRAHCFRQDDVTAAGIRAPLLELARRQGVRIERFHGD